MPLIRSRQCNVCGQSFIPRREGHLLCWRCFCWTRALAAQAVATRLLERAEREKP
jgi:hypothetical protein